jgi:hypothetical protein
LPFKRQIVRLEVVNIRRQLSNLAAVLSHSRSASKIPKKATGETMPRFDPRYLPRDNPCAQCGQPIAAPDWVEARPRRACYLWHCRACDYRFEAVAFFEDTERDSGALAA